jgi:hypothetical protein
MNGMKLLLLLAGGAVLALLLLIGAGAGAYFLFFRDSSPDNITSNDKDRGGGTLPGNGNKADPVAVKLHVPLKVGDVREIDASLDETANTTIQRVNQQTLEARGKKTIVFRGKVTTKEVDADGNQTFGEIAITEMTITHADQTTTVPSGKVIVQHALNGDFAYYARPGTQIPGEANVACADLFGYRVAPPGHLDGGVFGPTAPKAVGDSWPVNPAAAARWLANMPEGLQPGANAVAGSVTLTAMPREGEVTFLDLKADLHFTLRQVKFPGRDGTGTANGDIRYAFTMRCPKDGTTGPVQLTRTTAAQTVADCTAGIWAPGKVTHVVSQTLKMDIRYLPNEAAGKESTVLGGFRVAVWGSPLVEWIRDKKAVTVHLRYKTTGSAPPNAVYHFTIGFLDKDGTTKFLPLAVLPGDQLKADDTLRTEIAVDPQSLSSTQVCEILVQEMTAGGTPAVVHDKRDKVSIYGIPSAK